MCPSRIGQLAGDHGGGGQAIGVEIEQRKADFLQLIEAQDVAH